MKTFVSVIKWMWAIDKETFKLIGVSAIFIALLSIMMIQLHETYLFLILNGMPFVIFSMSHFGRYRKVFREIEEAVELRNKYNFLYNKMTKGGF